MQTILNCFLFTAGMIVQARFFLGEKFTKKTLSDMVDFAFLITICGGLVLVVLSLKNIFSFSILQYLFFLLLLFILGIGSDLAFVCARTMRDYINEGVLLLYTLLFWYVYLKSMHAYDVWALLLSIPTAVTFVVAFGNMSLLRTKVSARFLKATLYLWYTAILTYLALTSLPPGILKTGFAGQAPHEMFIVGMISLYFLVLCAYWSSIIPLGTMQTFDDIIPAHEGYSFALSMKYHLEQIKPLLLFVCAATVAIILFLNNAFHMLPDHLLIGIILVAAPPIIAKLPRFADPS